MADAIKDGDLVRLKSGGPLMTATYVGKSEAECAWFTPDENGRCDSGAFSRVSFAVAALELVKSCA